MWRLAVWALIAPVIPISTVCLAAAEGPALEYRIKAAFLLNFTKFTEWPAPEAVAPATPNAPTPFSICVLGVDPFGAALDQIVAGEVVNGSKIVVRRINAGVPPECGLVYVSTAAKDVAQTLKSIGPGVLTVGEGDSFLDEGGMIAFVIDDRRVRFNINRTAAQRAGLGLSSRLLNVARSVR
jgi:hypothetical protein